MEDGFGAGWSSSFDRLRMRMGVIATVEQVNARANGFVSSPTHDPHPESVEGGVPDGAELSA
jgi:hypothetical protein